MRFPALASLLAPFWLLGLAAPAFAQGSVNVYNWSDYIAENELKDFEKDTGIDVNYTTYESNEVLDSRIRTGRSGYDIVVPSITPFFVRQRQAGLFQPLDRARLRRLNNLDPEIMAVLAKFDPGNAYAIPWMWGTTGIGYNVAEIKKRMPDAPVDSLRMIFDPAVVAKFKDCGVTMVDSAADVFPAALNYLGLDPDSQSSEDLVKAADVVRAVRPFISNFDSSDTIDPLADGDVCLAFGYSGDISQARARAAKAKDRLEIAYVLPKEGSMIWIDVLVLLKEAPNVDNAYRFLNFMLDPRVVAASSEVTGYANANKAATALMPKSITGNPSIYPPPEVRSKFYTVSPGTADQVRERARLWTAMKAGR